ncbi:MAG: hypothetical protein HEQ35_07795 [Gloeotrichia echinulata IR180]
MSYVSLLKNIPEILSQPTGIAAIASVGIHGAMALIVPLMPIDSNQTKDSASKKSVGVMELSQADQQRLPQAQAANPSQFPLQSQFPPSPGTSFNPGALTALPVLPPAPPGSSQLVLAPIPTSGGNYRISSLPKGQSLRIVPRGNLPFDTSGFNTNSKFPQSVPRFNGGDIAMGEAQPLPINKLPTLPPGRMPDGLPNTPSPIPYGSTPNTTGQNNTTPQTPQSGDDASKVAQNGELIARIDTTPQVGDNLTLGQDSIPQWQQGSTPKTPELPAKITGQEISKVNSYEDLRKTVQQQYPSADEKAVIRDIIATDKPGQEGTVIGGLVVDADGKVLDIQFQDKSVSLDLLQKAREYFSTNPPKGHSKTSYYPFSLRFQNNSNTAGATQQPLPVQSLPDKPALTTPDVNSKQPVSVPVVNGKPAQTTPEVNSKQPVAAPVTSPKPLSEVLMRRKQPAPTPAATEKPAPIAPEVNSKQPAPASTPSEKPAQTTPEVNSKEPVSAPVTTRKPLSELLIRSKQPAPTPAATAAPDNTSNQSAPTVESAKELIRQLRELKEKTESSNSEQSGTSK